MSAWDEQTLYVEILRGANNAPLRMTNFLQLPEKLEEQLDASQAETLKFVAEAAEGAPEDEEGLLGANRWRSCCSEA
jgi:hypothetical protein